VPVSIRGASIRGVLTYGVLACCAAAAHAAETFDIGRDSNGTRIDAVIVQGSGDDAPLVALVGGLAGEDESAAAVRAAVERFDALPQRRRGITLLAIPLANPDGAALAFPPSGRAYRENAEANTLWRFIGAHAPDLVLISGGNDFGLGDALANEPAALVGRIPSRHWSSTDDVAALDAADVAPSEARRELERRRARTPRDLALELAEQYGHTLNQVWYIEALALRAQIELGRVEDVRKLAEPYASGEKNSLARPNALVMAGHLIFGDLARATGDPRYVALVRKVADLGFDENGKMLESMPYHGEFSDSIFMGTVSLAQAGALTGERKYFDMAVRHLEFMQRLDLRPDGLYRHQPATDAAWGRGNGFAALGLALLLSDLPHDHPGFGDVLESYRAHMAALLPYQNRDGLWRNVIDVPGAYPEFSGTAMIGFAMQRGLENGWLENEDAYRAAVARAWDAVNARTGAGGTFIDICESTARIESLEGYLDREAILGTDPRGGAMALIFATELMR
jgi:rhamnogalacturonyl hydrolase YesR